MEDENMSEENTSKNIDELTAQLQKAENKIVSLKNEMKTQHSIEPEQKEEKEIEEVKEEIPKEPFKQTDISLDALKIQLDEMKEELKLSNNRNTSNMMNVTWWNQDTKDNAYTVEDLEKMSQVDYNRVSDEINKWTSELITI